MIVCLIFDRVYLCLCTRGMEFLWENGETLYSKIVALSFSYTYLFLYTLYIELEYLSSSSWLFRKHMRKRLNNIPEKDLFILKICGRLFLDWMPINLISPLSKSVRNEREERRAINCFTSTFEARGEFECHWDNEVKRIDGQIFRQGFGIVEAFGVERKGVGSVC